MNKKTARVLVAFLVLLGAMSIMFLYIIKAPNVQIDDEKKIFYIPTHCSHDQLMKMFRDSMLLKSEKTFSLLSEYMQFESPKPGRYLIENGISNYELISLLRLGKQEPINLTFNNQRTIFELCGTFGRELEGDSLQFLELFLDSTTLNELKLSKENVLSLFLPNTYQVYWNSSPKQMLERMTLEHSKFWNSNRKAQLERLGLNKEECYTLASIVQKESNMRSEMPRIAGVYLNRLKRRMLLQADPTVVFAVGDFSIRRVLNRHLEVDSPYNTYRYIGLPPGPICMPDINTIDAVLNAESHNYLYFCVQPGDKIGHIFATNLAQHNRNAKDYQRWLNQNQIFN